MRYLHTVRFGFCLSGDCEPEVKNTSCYSVRSGKANQLSIIRFFFISIKKNSLGFMGQINVVPEQLASLNEGPEPLVCYLQPPTHTLEAAAQ